MGGELIYIVNTMVGAIPNQVHGIVLVFSSQIKSGGGVAKK